MKYWDAAGGRELALLAPSYIFASSWRQLESDERGTNGWLEYFRMNGRIMSGVQLFLSPITNEGTEVLHGYSKIFVCRNDFYRFSGCLTLEKNYIYIYTFWDWCNIERYFGDVQRRNGVWHWSKRWTDVLRYFTGIRESPLLCRRSLFLMSSTKTPLNEKGIKGSGGSEGD